MLSSVPLKIKAAIPSRPSLNAVSLVSSCLEVNRIATIPKAPSLIWQSSHSLNAKLL